MHLGDTNIIADETSRTIGTRPLNMEEEYHVAIVAAGGAMIAREPVV